MSIKNTKVPKSTYTHIEVKSEDEPLVNMNKPIVPDSELKEIIKKPRKIRKVKEIENKNPKVEAVEKVRKNPVPPTPKARPSSAEKKEAKLEAAKKLVAEHERLVKVLDSGTPKAQKKEAKIQKKDLVEAKKEVKEEKKASSWIEHVKKVQASKGISYREAMKVAKDSYKK